MSKFFFFLLYSFIFLCLGGSLVEYAFGVSPFNLFSWSTNEIYLNPLSDWGTLYRRLKYNNLTIDSTNLPLFFSFLFFYPIYIGLWFLLSNLPWKRKILKVIVHHRRKKEKNKQMTEGSSLKTYLSRPKALEKPKSSNRSSMLNQLAAQKEAEMAQLAEASTEAPAKLEQLSPEIINQIRELGKKYGYDLFENVKLGEIMVPLVLATDEEALLLKFLFQEREWIADENIPEDASEPTWFSTEGLITSPFFELQPAVQSLQEQEPTSHVRPVVVLCEGSIMNSLALIDTWAQKDCTVATFQNGKAEAISSLEEVLSSGPQTTLSAIDQPDQAEMSNMANVSSYIHSPELQEKIENLGQKYGFELFTNVHLGQYIIPFVLAADDQALLLRPLMEPHDWLVDEDGTVEHPEPTWFSTEYLIASPFYEVDRAAQILQKQEPTSLIQPIVLLCDGSILNAKQWLNYWKNKNGTILLMDKGQGKGLISLEDFLDSIPK